MPKGGVRPGSGRKKGSTNQRIKRLRSEMRSVALKIRQVIPDAFEGDGHALMVAVYKDPSMPVEIRLDAAKAAARYERPQLQAVEMTGKGGGPIATMEVSDAERARALAAFIAKTRMGK